MQGNNWVAPICVLLCAATFGTAFFVLRQNNQEPRVVVLPALAEQGPPIAAAPPKTGDTTGELPGTQDPRPAEPDKKDPSPTPKLLKASYRSWNLPAPDNLVGLEKGTYDVKEITLSDNGTQALVKSKRVVHCLNLVTGRIEQTFQPAKPRWDYQKPETQFMFLAPDASFVIVGSEAQSIDKKTEAKDVTIYGAATGKVLGKGSLDERSGMHGFAETAVFTPHGDYLLLPTFHFRDGLLIQSVRTNSGEVRMLDIPAKKEKDRSWDLTLSVPQDPKTLLIHRRGGGKTNPGGITALDLQSGAQKPITALTVDPWNLFNRGVQLTMDGKLLMSQGIKSLQVCDWRADQRLLEVKLDQMNNARFTPDGKRVIVHWIPQYQIIFIGGPKKSIENVQGRLELYDITSQKKIGEFTPEKHGLNKQIHGLAVSRDGKTLVWGSETSVVAIDFKEAFGLDPLPSPSRPTGSDVLP